jgi:hypothetical protein
VFEMHKAASPDPKKSKFPLFLTILKGAIFLSRGRDLSRLAYTLSFGWCK